MGDVRTVAHAGRRARGQCCWETTLADRRIAGAEAAGRRGHIEIAVARVGLRGRLLGAHGLHARRADPEEEWLGPEERRVRYTLAGAGRRVAPVVAVRAGVGARLQGAAGIELTV